MDEFIETFSKNDDKYNAWFNEEEEDDDGEEENTGVSDKGVEMNTRTTPLADASRKQSFLLPAGAGEDQSPSTYRRRNSSITPGIVKRKMSLADMCAPEDLLRKIRNNREYERRKTQHRLEVFEQMEKQRRETVKVNMLDQELKEMDELLTKVAENTTNSTRFEDTKRASGESVVLFL